MLIVAIHDVTPAELGEVRWLLGQLDAMGVRRRVLKVVPAVPGAPAGPELVDLLLGEVSTGSELVLHGWTHRGRGSLRGSALDRLRARLFAAGSAEFLTLPDEEVARLVAAGRAWLAERSLHARGFCPPAWLATAALAPALRDAGFDYVLTLRGLRNVASGTRIDLPPVGYMGAGSVQEALVRVGGAVVSGPLRALVRSPAHRVFIHPRHASTSADCARVLRQVGRLARTHRSVTYSDLV